MDEYREWWGPIRFTSGGLGGGRTEMTVRQSGWKACPFLDLAQAGLSQSLD